MDAPIKQGDLGKNETPAVTEEKRSKHAKNSFRKVMHCHVLPEFALLSDYIYIAKSITKRTKCGKPRQAQDINRGKNVAETEVYYYSDDRSHINYLVLPRNIHTSIFSDFSNILC